MDLKEMILKEANRMVCDKIGEGEFEIYDVKINFRAKRVDVDDRGIDLDEEFNLEVK